MIALSTRAPMRQVKRRISWFFFPICSEFLCVVALHGHRSVFSTFLLFCRISGSLQLHQHWWDTWKWDGYVFIHHALSVLHKMHWVSPLRSQGYSFLIFAAFPIKSLIDPNCTTTINNATGFSSLLLLKNWIVKILFLPQKIHKSFAHQRCWPVVPRRWQKCQFHSCL